jgi:yopX protein|nr:MAG TPA: YopX protein [Caudoviricetes sp.]
MTPKFRAWDKETKTMNGMAEIYRNRNQEIELHPRDENIILMQSTNLKDLKSIEIFEGDILEIQGLRMVVKFGSYNYIEPSNSGCGAMDYTYDGLGFYVELINFVFLDGISPFEPETLKESVVIGNRFENPEFLKEV